MSQDNIFYEKEGNGWFNRNMIGEYRYSDKFKEMMGTLKVLDLYKIHPQKVLDVGSSNGLWLSYVYEKFKCECHAVEPSEEAIKDGMKKYPFIKFNRGTANQISYPDESFDLIHMNFVFSWISRETLLKSVSEIDRVLKNDGFFLLRDFYCKSNEKIKYHHAEGVWTYKQDYSKLFTSTERYDLITMLTGSEHDEIALEKNKNKTTAISLLQKNNDLYKITELK